MSLVYQDLLEMQEQQKQQAAKAQKRQYEYDSDEDIDEDEGTWEHKARRLEMTKTAREAEKLTKEARGKHHIGDFLPPDELTKFLKKVSRNLQSCKGKETRIISFFPVRGRQERGGLRGVRLRRQQAHRQQQGLQDAAEYGLERRERAGSKRTGQDGPSQPVRKKNL